MELIKVYARNLAGNIGQVLDWDHKRNQSLVKFAGRNAEWIDDIELVDVPAKCIDATTLGAIG